MRNAAPIRLLLLTTVTLALGMTGCGQSSPPPVTDTTAETTAQDDAAAQATAAAQAAEEAKVAELAAREQELADREAALEQKELEAELAKRDAENAAAAAAAQKDAAARQAAATKASAAKAAAAPAAPKAAPPPTPIVVPAGTQLALEIVTPVSTKTNAVGDRVEARLASDLMIGSRRAAKAGASVQGSITQVVSGSKKVGGTPTLGISFDSLVVANGSSVPISAPLVQTGKSETGKDTAKIVGGAAAGAIIGNQVSSKNGSVVGGLLGGAAGTAIAHKTGGEVTLAAGQAVTVATQSSFEVRP